MSFFTKLKTYFVSYEEEPEKEEIKTEVNGEQQQPLRKESLDSFELILEDIIEADQKPLENESNERMSQKYNSDFFEPLELEKEDDVEIDEEQEQCQYIYATGIVFIDKFSEGREITLEEWNEMIEKQNLSLQSQKNIYFSILKGIHFSVRKKVWELLSNTADMKKLTTFKYSELLSEEFTPHKEISIIDKDVPRSVNITKFLPELRNILIAYVNFSGKSYTQGMNLIAGSLLEMLSYDNDEELKEFEIIEQNFEERVFWVFVGVMKWRNWEHVFERDLSGLKEMLGKLEKLMVKNVPAVYQKIIDYDWDLTIFSQYYITILLYNTPKEFSKIILDLFLLDGENVLHSLIIKMLKLNEDRILEMIEEGDLMEYFKRKMIHETFERLQKDKLVASKLEDFQINFLEYEKI